MSDPDLDKRMAEVGRRLGSRESAHADALAEARQRADALHARVAAALAHYHEGLQEVGAPHLGVELSAPRLDDKHIRSVEFELQRGRHRAIVTVKSRGEVTLVGPFKAGKNEGPCRSFPWDSPDEVDGTLGDFLERFLEDAATP